MVRLVIYDKESSGSKKKVKDIREQEVYLGEMPLMTSAPIAAEPARDAPISKGERRHLFVDDALLSNMSGGLSFRMSHYDTISAFIKSIRGSDPDAALYWMAKMLHAGEDPRFIARRLVISASEDVGLADSNGLRVALAAQQAFEFLGMPEGRIPLAQAITYLACAPRSNAAYLAMDRALEAVREHGSLPVPMHLRNAPTGLMKSMGYGEGYAYPHDAPGGFVSTRNLPEALGLSLIHI